MSMEFLFVLLVVKLPAHNLIAFCSQLLIDLDFFDCILLAFLCFVVTMFLQFILPSTLCNHSASSTLTSASRVQAASAVEFEAHITTRVLDVVVADSNCHRGRFELSSCDAEPVGSSSAFGFLVFACDFSTVSSPQVLRCPLWVSARHL